VHYFHIHEDEQLDEAQFTAWVEVNQPIAWRTIVSVNSSRVSDRKVAYFP